GRLQSQVTKARHLHTLLAMLPSGGAVLFAATLARVNFLPRDLDMESRPPAPSGQRLAVRHPEPVKAQDCQWRRKVPRRPIPTRDRQWAFEIDQLRRTACANADRSIGGSPRNFSASVRVSARC